MKHLTEDPWDSIDSTYPVDSEVKGKIVRMLDRGVVVELADGIEGFIPVSKLTAEYIKVPADAFKVGDEVPAVPKSIRTTARSTSPLLTTSRTVNPLNSRLGWTPTSRAKTAPRLAKLLLRRRRLPRRRLKSLKKKLNLVSD